MSKIGAAADELNEALEDAEDALAALFNVPAAVPLDDARSVHFGKYDSAWRIYVMSATGQTVLSTSIALRDRVAIAARLPALLEELRKEARLALNNVESATMQARAFAAALNAERPT